LAKLFPNFGLGRSDPTQTLDDPVLLLVDPCDGVDTWTQKLTQTWVNFWVEFSTRVWLSLRSSFRPQTLPKLDPKVDRPDPEKCQTLRFRNLKFGRSKKKWPYFRGRKVTIKVAAFLVTFLDGENELKVARLTALARAVLIYILLIKLSTFRPPPTRPTGSVWGWFPGRETSSLPLFRPRKVLKL
jgi:hypothetical protein